MFINAYEQMATGVSDTTSIALVFILGIDISVDSTGLNVT